MKSSKLLAWPPRLLVGTSGDENEIVLLLDSVMSACCEMHEDLPVAWAVPLL